MKRRYLAFDIEIAKLLPEEVGDLKQHRPLGICCAAALESDEKPELFYGRDADGRPAEVMTQTDVSNMVDYLQEKVQAGYTVVTWNGLGFDFDILAEESGREADCRKLAVEHVDMMFHVFCEKGYPVSLDAAAQGIGTPGKPEGINAAMAPKLWADGETQTVLDYVAHDCEITLQVATVNEQNGFFQWVTRKGTNSRFNIRQGWLPVREALELPVPDTSWMTKPAWSRDKFAGWLS